METILSSYAKNLFISVKLFAFVAKSKRRYRFNPKLDFRMYLQIQDRWLHKTGDN
jgi:hypothetical protein